ncbi:hypothetical protein J2D73_03790 [Acetobacter sacchari]|uniref:Uncharacterized protein n=1 Tax=Acetobacter sacchari TaxID=2661687 RepID=A0ABS3LSN8_9PROT|nr:hypothetical protein [Acetobacter sacchari]
MGGYLGSRLLRDRLAEMPGALEVRLTPESSPPSRPHLKERFRRRAFHHSQLALLLGPVSACIHRVAAAFQAPAPIRYQRRLGRAARSHYLLAAAAPAHRQLLLATEPLDALAVHPIALAPDSTCSRP